MATISNVSVVLTGRDAGAISTMQRLQAESRETARAVESINKRMDDVLSAGSGGGRGIAPVVDLWGLGQSVAGALAEQVNKLTEALDTAEQQADLAEVMGFTYQQMQALNVAATLANTSVDSLSGAFGRFLKTVSDAAGGNKGAIDDLARQNDV